MLRFIIKRSFKDSLHGLETVDYETLLLDVPELEDVLKRGGSSDSGYDHSSLMGVEIIWEYK